MDLNHYVPSCTTHSVRVPTMTYVTDVRAMSLFRALREKNEGQMEVSERALALTDMLVHMNPANYTVWQCRAHVLIQMALSGQENDRLYKELDFLDTFALVNMKNYQVWYANMTLTRRQHRKLIVSILGDPTRELDFVSSVLDHDGKNYHTWAYRQWILAHFGGLGFRDESVSAVGAGQYPHFWASDIAYADKMIQDDVRNNSAYNHRWYCIFGRAMHGRSELPAEMEEVRDAEIKYVCCFLT